MNAKTYHARKEQGICVECAKQPPETDMVRCQSCADRQRESNRRHGAKSRGATAGAKRKSWYQAMKEQGLCPRCGKRAPAPGRTCCKECLDKDKTRKVTTKPKTVDPTKTVYEIVQIDCGQETLLLATNDKQEARTAYRGAGRVRARVNGRKLLIHEADKLFPGDNGANAHLHKENA